jgi:hypothetical protein
MFLGKYRQSMKNLEWSVPYTQVVKSPTFRITKNLLQMDGLFFLVTVIL